MLLKNQRIENGSNVVDRKEEFIKMLILKKIKIYIPHLLSKIVLLYLTKYLK